MILCDIEIHLRKQQQTHKQLMLFYAFVHTLFYDHKKKSHNSLYQIFEKQIIKTTEQCLPTKV